MFQLTKKFLENGKIAYRICRLKPELNTARDKIVEYYVQLDKKLLDEEDKKMLAMVGEDGRIDLDKIPNMLIPNGIAATAWYADGWYFLPTEELCLKKKMLSFMGQYKKFEENKFQPEEYNAMICPALAEMFGLTSAKYFMAKEKGTEYMLTPNFLEKGEELIHIARIEEFATGKKQSTNAIQGASKRISDMYRYLEKYLESHEFEGEKLDESQKNKVLLQFLEQKFFNRFIKSTDEHVFNTAIIIKGKDVKMSPMYDYDFTLTRRTTDTVPGCDWSGLENEMLLDNGKSDIISFMEQYQNYPGMQEFFSNFLRSFSIEKLEKIIEREIGVKVDKEEISEHYKMINDNFAEMKRTYDRLYPKGIGEGGER